MFLLDIWRGKFSPLHSNYSTSVIRAYLLYNLNKKNHLKYFYFLNLKIKCLEL